MSESGTMSGTVCGPALFETEIEAISDSNTTEHKPMKKFTDRESQVIQLVSKHKGRTYIPGFSFVHTVVKEDDGY